MANVRGSARMLFRTGVFDTDPMQISTQALLSSLGRKGARENDKSESPKG